MKEDWTYKKLGEVCEVLDSKRKPVTKSDRISGIYPYYGATGIQDYVDKFIFDGDYLLVGEDGAKWGTNDKTAYQIHGKCWVNNHAHILKINDDIANISFLEYYLVWKDLGAFITGAIVQKLTQAALVSIPVPIPPIETQSRIVSELNLLQSIIDKQQAQLKELGNLAQAVFYDMFGEPETNNKCWDIAVVGDVFLFIRNGANIKQTKGAKGLPITRIETLSGDVFNRDRLGYADVFDADEYKHYILDNNDILMSHINSKQYVGRSLVYKKLKGEIIIHGMNLLRLKPIESILDAVYAKFLFDSFYFKKQIASIRKDAVNQSSITVGDLKKLNLLLPPISLQQSFAKKIESIEKQKSAISQSIAETQKLFDYTMDKYFG